jgi:glycosyltransferase involved in cell wall biosynthesis
MTPDYPLVSIVTPVYNGVRYLDELIRSVQAQDYPNIEHIIIDDGSTDAGATAAVLGHYPHLRSWSRENRGQYATMNEGLDAAKGEWICFVSADDRVEPSAVRRVVEYMHQHPELDGVVGYTQAMNETGKPYADPPFQFAPYRFYAYLMQISHCSLYLKREVLLRYRLYFDASLRYVGDYDWIIRIVDKLQVGRLPRPLSTIRIHPAQASREHKRSMIEEQKRIAEKFRVNPLLFSISNSLYIFFHDLTKLRFALVTGGIKGAKRLIQDHGSRGKTIAD